MFESAWRPVLRRPCRNDSVSRRPRACARSENAPTSARPTKTPCGFCRREDTGIGLNGRGDRRAVDLAKLSQRRAHPGLARPVARWPKRAAQSRQAEGGGFLRSQGEGRRAGRCAGAGRGEEPVSAGDARRAYAPEARRRGAERGGGDRGAGGTEAESGRKVFSAKAAVPRLGGLQSALLFGGATYLDSR